MKIIAMLPVKNESWALEHCLKSLSFCDEILAIDDNSTDNTRDILIKYNCTIIPLDTETRVGWKEFEMRSYLLAAARRRNATHIIGIDGDEMFSDSFVADARDILNSLQKGESLSLPWINVLSVTTQLNPTLDKQFCMCDDGKSFFLETFMHVPRVPTYKPGKILSEPYAVLHFQHLNKKRNIYKNIWYMMSELVKGDRHPIRINATYTHTNQIIEPSDIQILTKEPLPNPEKDTAIWQEGKIQEMFLEKGITFFEPINIWHIPGLREKFVSEVGREPKPSLAPGWLLYINNLKNKIKNHI